MRPTYPGENGGGVRPTPSYFGAVSSGTNQMRGYVGHLRGATSRSLGRTHDVELINLTSLPFQCDVMHGGLCTNDKNVTLKAGEKRRFGTLCSTTSVVVRRVQEKTVLPAPDRHDSPTAIDVRLDPVTGALVVQVQAVSRGMGRRTRGGLLGISADVIVNNSTPVAVRCQVKVGVLCRDKDEMVAANSVANIVNDCAPEQIHITLVQSAVLSPVPRGSTFTAKLLEVTEANGVLKINAGGEATRGMQARTRGGVGGAANNVDLHNDTQVAISGKIEVPSVFCANKAFTLAPGAAMTIVNNCEPSRVVFDRPTKDAFVIPQAKHHPGRAAKMTLQEEGGGGFVMRTDAGTVSPYVAPPPPPPVTNDVLLQNNLPVTVSGQIYVTNCQNEPFSLDPGQQYHFSARTPCLALQVMLDNPSRMGFNVPRGRRQALVTLEQQGGQWVMRTDAGTEKART